MTPLLPWIVAGVCLASGALALLLLRREQGQRRALAAEHERVLELADAAERRFEEKTRELRRRGEESAELRKKLEKVRRRAAREKDEQRDEGARLHELEMSLRRARSELEQAQRERDEATRAAATPAPAPPPDPDPGEIEARKALEERAEGAEGRVAALEAELHKGAEEAARWRKKAKALEVAYAAQTGELEAKRDRLRTQQEELERLLALRAQLAAGPEPRDGASESAEAPGAGAGPEPAPEAGDPTGEDESEGGRPPPEL